MPTTVQLSDRAVSAGAEGMPMVSAIVSSLAFSGEFSSVRPCGWHGVMKSQEKIYQQKKVNFVNRFMT